MATIPVSYDLKWQLNFAPNYQFDSKGNCVNVLRNRLIKRVVVGYSIGYCIKGKFYTLNTLREKLELIPIIKTPF